jgi:hypothetical protein
MKRFFLTCALIFSFGAVSLMYSQSWSIRVTPIDYPGDHLLLAYYLGNSQYVRDTAYVVDGVFTFTGEDTLASGVYLVVFLPDNQFFQLIVAEGETDIRIEVDTKHISHPTNVTGSPETERFYEYIAFLQQQRPRADELRKVLDTLPDSAEKTSLKTELDSINAAVKAYQKGVVDTHPGSLTAMLIASNFEIEAPDFTGTSEEVQLQTYQYVKSHYFDHVPMQDPRLCRTPILQQRIDYYINKLTHQVPDSIIGSVDFILGQFEPGSEAFQIYLVHFLNAYAKSNIVGMDAVYVHLVDKYYAQGMATWTEEDVLNKILKNAETIKPLLIGKIAPDLLVYDRENHPTRLHSVEARYTVLFFWDPDCGHCKKSLPMVVDFYDQYHDKGVELFAVCTCLKDEVGKCWEAIDERNMGAWVNVADPYLRSRFKQIYDIRSTPQIYVLDHDKKIVMKKIGAEKLSEVMEHLMENGS